MKENVDQKKKERRQKKMIRNGYICRLGLLTKQGAYRQKPNLPVDSMSYQLSGVIPFCYLSFKSDSTGGNFNTEYEI